MVGGVEGTDDDVLLPVGFPAVLHAVLQSKAAMTNPGSEFIVLHSGAATTNPDQY